MDACYAVRRSKVVRAYFRYSSGNHRSNHCMNSVKRLMSVKVSNMSVRLQEHEWVIPMIFVCFGAGYFSYYPHDVEP